MLNQMFGASVSPPPPTPIYWQQVVNENGSTFANFTAATGTWTSDGAVIKQTDTTATQRRAKYNTPLISPICIVEMEVQVRSAGTNRQGGFFVGFDGSSGSYATVRIDEGADTLGVDTDTVAQRINFSITIATNTWYKIRSFYVGGIMTLYLDGVLRGTTALNASAAYNGSYIGLFSYQAEAWWRNIKAWTLGGFPT